MGKIINEIELSVEICSADQAYSHLHDLSQAEIEEFWVLALGPNKRLLCSRMLFRGTVDYCMVHPRDVFRFACVANASSIIIAHNHPSQQLSPSDHDIRITRELIRAGRLLQIPVLDHLLITTKGYVSFATQGWCRFPDG